MKFESVGDLLVNAANRWSEKPALFDETGQTVSYGALNRMAGIFAGRLLVTNLKRGDRVGLLGRNSFEWVAAYFGILRAGGTVVPLNSSQSAQDLAGPARDSGLSVLFHDRELSAKAAGVLQATGARALFLEATRHSFASSDVPRVGTRGLEEVASIVYTSGSTQKPLGVMLTHRNFLANHQAVADYMRLTAEDRVLCVLPFHYIYGLSLLFSHFFGGGSIILENRFAYPQTALEAMERGGATGFAGVSSHYAILINQTDFVGRRLETLRYFAHAGDKMPVPVTEKILKAFPRKELYLMYGQTEAAPRISYLAPPLAFRKPASVGKPLMNIELQIVREDDTSCLPNEEGEILVRGPNVMAGYWNAPQETQRVLRNGWLYTGDLGYQDEEGDLFVTGRKKLFLKIGGHRVSPLEIEAAAMEHGGLFEAAAAGVPDAVFGQRLKLFVVRKKDAAFGKEDLLDFLKKRLAVYKVPSEIEILPFLPKNGHGKVDKQKLQTVRPRE